MEQDIKINEKAGSQFQAFSEETDLLSAEEQEKTEIKGMKMPSFKDLFDRWKALEYPFNQLSRFY